MSGDHGVTAVRLVGRAGGLVTGIVRTAKTDATGICNPSLVLFIITAQVSYLYSIFLRSF